MASQSYRRLLLHPAYGLYIDNKLVASIRAPDASIAKELFREHGLQGDRVKQIGKRSASPSLTPRDIDLTQERLLERYT